MARARSTDVRLRVGTWSALADVPAATYGIINFAVQTDQYGAAGSAGQLLIPWAAPVLPAPGEYARIKGYADGSSAPDGFYEVTWAFSLWTLDMMNLVILPTWFPGGIYSNEVTIAQPDYSGSSLEWFHITAYRPVRNEEIQDFEIVPGGYADVKIRMSIGTKFTPV